MSYSENEELGGEDRELPLGERLLEKGVLTEDQLRIAVLEQEGSQETIGRVLVNLGFVTEATIRDVLSETQNAETVDLRQINVDPDALNLIPMEIAKRYNILPFALKDGNKPVGCSGQPQRHDRLRADTGHAWQRSEPGTSRLQASPTLPVPLTSTTASS